MKIITLFCTLFSLANAKGPDFIIIGAGKSGTTSLYNYICKHPKIVAAKKKELHFFDQNYELGSQWYFNQFPKSLPLDCITGEATPNYLFYKEIPLRVIEICPEAKFIITLRNPVTSIFSRYKMLLRTNRVKGNFEDALKANKEYLERGLYLTQIQNWLSVFPKEQFLLLIMEQWITDIDGTMQKIFDFLNIPSYHQEEYPIFFSDNDPSVTLSEETRAVLEAFYKPHNDALQNYLNKELELDIILPWDYTLID